MAPTPGPIPGTVGPIVQDDPNFMMTPKKGATVSTKGLLNMPGQNNCFLNSAVQVLWHLDSFRRNFREVSSHACMAESCIFCALKELFTQFQYSQESALPPDALRHALAKTFCDQRRFQLGFMDDAAECFENILLRIHVHIANQEGDDMCGHSNCIPHQKFAMTLVEQRMCQNCSSASEPLPFTQMVHYVTTSALCAKSTEMLNESSNRQLTSFGKLLRLAGEMGEIRECPSGCGGSIQSKKTLMNYPEVVSIGLVWDSESPTLQHITDVFHSIGMYLGLQDMFHNVYDSEWANATTHQLVGVVTYYGKHYSTFFFHTKLGVWIYFDDATVREVGPSWEQVVEKCQKGRFQPLLLLFANPDSSFSSMKQDHNHPNSILCDPHNKPSVMNQRQAVINQYLKFQNSQMGSYSKPKYGLTICAKGQDPYVNNYMPDKYSSNAHNIADQGLTIKNTGSGANFMNYAYETNHNSNLPVYSNLQYLNSLQQSNEHADFSKLPLPANLLSSNGTRSVIPNGDLQMYNALDISNAVKDFEAAKDSDSAFTEEDAEVNDMYISRKAVESVLNHLNNQLDNGLIRRDSGSWGSDRNSSSSSNSVENPFLTVVASKRLLLGLNKKPQLQDTNSSDHGYDSFSVSSSDSYPSVNGSPVKVEPRLTQIPEDWFPEEEEENDLNKKLSIVTKDDSGPPDCDKLCAEADLLLAKSHEKEKDGDLVMAALLSDSAAARARAAMEAPYNNSKSLICAKKKHSTCVMRSSNLYRRIKDHELDERRKQKNHIGHHSRQSSRDSTHSKHSRQSSKDSTHSKSGNKENSPNSDDGDNFGKNIEIYGTLPKKGSKKKSAASGSTKAKDDQVYKDFLNKQRKNTSLSEALNETMLKNVDQPKSRSESSPKRKSHSSNDRKSFEGIPAKSPTRKKDTPPKGDGDVKKKPPKPQSSQVPQANSRNSAPDIGSRDLLSPITTPDKKQHKIKRKLMGNFMKRKNRSLPDLREDSNSTDQINCFLDDALIEVPTNSSGVKSKCSPKDTKTAQIKRNVYQPHHALVKKDLSHRALPLKVNIPNVQSPALPSPKIKLMHTLPSIGKKPQEPPIETSYNTIAKPSKIPFMTSTLKYEQNLPPLPLYKPIDASYPKTGLIPSAIPVLAPQIPLSPIKPNIVPKDSFSVNNYQNSDEQVNDLDLPQPTNSFLAELQAKRKQVLNKSSQKQESSVNTNQQNCPSSIEREGLSMLPKLAIHGEGTSWLKELQSKQQQFLSKQDTIKSIIKPNNLLDREIKPQIPNKAVEYQRQEPTNYYQKNWKLLPESISEVDGVSSSNLSAGVQVEAPNQVQQIQAINNSIPNHQVQTSNSYDQTHQVPHTTTSSQIHQVPATNTSNKFHQTSLTNTSNHILQMPHTNTSPLSPYTNTPNQMSLTNTSHQIHQLSHPSTSNQMSQVQATNRSNQIHQVQATNTANSVKSLASRFEKVLKPVVPQSPSFLKNGAVENRSLIVQTNVTSSRDSRESGMDNQNTTPDAQNLPCEPLIKTEINCVTLKSALKVRSDFNYNNPNEINYPSSSDISDSTSKIIKSVLKPTSHTAELHTVGLPLAENSTSQRPVQPPDYATALQRIGMIKTSPSDGGFTPLEQLSLSNPPKKKQGPKKTVTFSDEVVLVACAEYDEIDFSSNPLFERVYQQHVESGKGEIPILSNSYSNNYSVESNRSYDYENSDSVNVNSPSSCNLCHSKPVTSPKIYCTDCEFYLSRFKPSD